MIQVEIKWMKNMKTFGLLSDLIPLSKKFIFDDGLETIAIKRRKKIILIAMKNALIPSKIKSTFSSFTKFHEWGSLFPMISIESETKSEWKFSLKYQKISTLCTNIIKNS